MNRTFVAGLGAVLTLSLSACGGSSSSGDHAAAVARGALTAELLRQSASAASPFRFTEPQARCVANRVVSAVGTSGLQTYGLLNADNLATTKTLDDTILSTKDATAVVNAIIGCLGAGNVTQALTAAVGKSIKGTASAPQRACIEEKLTIGVLKPMLIATLSGNKATAQAFVQGLSACMPATR